MVGKEGEEMPKKGIQKKYHLHIRLNDFEQEDLVNIANSIGQTMSDFVRTAILEKKERVRMYNENKDKTSNIEN